MEKNYFYSQTELEDMIHALSTSHNSVVSLSKDFAKKFGRGQIGVLMKLHTLAKGISRPKKEKLQKPAKIKVEKVTVPKTIGIDVPEGTSFDFTNVKRVVLQKKSLTIYF
jgi:hypothetical protein